MGQAKTVRDIMTTDVITLSEEDNLLTSAEEMDVFGLRHLPVVDGGKLVGLVTHRDILANTVSALHPDAVHRSMDRHDKQDTFVASIMTRQVMAVRPDTPLEEAAQSLNENRFGCLPVTEADGTLVGIVTEADFMGLLVELLREGKKGD